jgi:hypothetical protein
MFPNNYGHTGSDDGYAPLTSAQNRVQNDTLTLLVPGPGGNLRHCPHADSSAPRSTALERSRGQSGQILSAAGASEERAHDVGGVAVK